MKMSENREQGMMAETTKIKRGHYRISREDGYFIEVKRSIRGDWYQTSNMSRRPFLRQFVFDMESGYMPRDLMGADQ